MSYAVGRALAETMLNEQVRAGNKRNPQVFLDMMDAGTHSGGFNWGASITGQDFWQANIFGPNSVYIEDALLEIIEEDKAPKTQEFLVGDQKYVL